MKYQIGSRISFNSVSGSYRVVGYANYLKTRGYLVHREGGWLRSESSFFSDLTNVELDPEYTDTGLWWWREEDVSKEVCSQCGQSHE